MGSGGTGLRAVAPDEDGADQRPPEIVIGDVGRIVSDPRVDPSGRPTQVDGAEALAAFEFGAPIQPARTIGSQFADPDLRGIDGNSGFLGTFGWNV